MTSKSVRRTTVHYQQWIWGLKRKEDPTDVKRLCGEARVDRAEVGQGSVAAESDGLHKTMFAAFGFSPPSDPGCIQLDGQEINT